MVRRCGREHDFRMVQVPVGRFAVVGSQEADSACFALLPFAFAATPFGTVVGNNGITRCLRAALRGYYAQVSWGHYWPSGLSECPTLVSQRCRAVFSRTQATDVCQRQWSCPCQSTISGEIRLGITSWSRKSRSSEVEARCRGGYEVANRHLLCVHKSRPGGAQEA